MAKMTTGLMTSHEVQTARHIAILAHYCTDKWIACQTACSIARPLTIWLLLRIHVQLAVVFPAADLPPNFSSINLLHCSLFLPPTNPPCHYSILLTHMGIWSTYLLLSLCVLLERIIWYVPGKSIILGLIFGFFSSSVADSDHQWGWWPMGDDSSRWVSRTRRWQSPRLHQNHPPSLHLGKLLGNAPVLISTLCPPHSHGWASKWGEMGLLTSRLFSNVGPTLPSTLLLQGIVYWLKGTQKLQIRNGRGWHLTSDICFWRCYCEHYGSSKL